MALSLIAASKTDTGKQREQNEDNCYAHIVAGDQYVAGLFIVSDGMGGYHAGEVASKIAIETISESLAPSLGPTSAQPTVPLSKGKGKRGRSNLLQRMASVAGRDDPAKTRPLPETVNETASAETASATGGSSDVDATNGASGPLAGASAPATPTDDDAGATQELGESLLLEHYADRLRQAVEQSSEAVVTYGKQHAEARGLGATLTAALILGNQAFIANVGDSRTYLLRDGKLQRITVDHSLVERLVEAGQIDREDVYDHPNRNLIYRSLGAGRSDVDVDIFTERLRPGDVLLLCSDGLWEMVRDAQLESILNEVADPVEACNILVERANENGGEDNITAVLVRCVEA